MYTACTFQLAHAMDLPFLYVIPRYFIYIALLAWLAVFVGLMRRLLGPPLNVLIRRRQAKA